MSRVDPYYTRQFRRADDDMVRDYYLHQADDDPAANEPLSDNESAAVWSFVLACVGCLLLASIAVFLP